MADQAPFCIHCGVQQLNADSRFCYRCGQPIVPTAMPGRRQRPPWVGPVLVSAVILLVAAVVFARLLTGGPIASKTGAATPAPPAAAGTVTPATAVQSLGVQATPPTATPPTAEIAPTREAPTPPPTETPIPTETLQPTPTLANVTPGPLRLTRLAWSTDGKLLAVGSGTGVYLYDAATWQETRFIPLQVSVPSSLGDGPDQLAFSFDGALLATLDRIVQVWQVVDGSLAYELKASGFLGTSPAEGLWATFGEEGSTSGNLRLWRTSDGQLVRTIATNLNFPFSLAFSSDGRLIAAGPMEGSAPGVWQVADGRLLARLNWEMADAFGWADLAFQPNAATVAAVGGLVPEAVLLLWDANSGFVTRQLVALHEMPQGPTLNGVSYAADGSLLAGSFRGSGDQQSKVQLWGANGARGPSWTLPGSPYDIAFSPDGRLLAIVTGQSLYLYNPTDGSVVHQVKPVWRQGILPTPTPTPLAVTAPGDWKKYVRTEDQFAISYPPYWTLASWGTDHADFVAGRASEFKPESSMIVSIQVMGSCGFTLDGASNTRLMDELKRTDDEQSITVYGLRGSGGRVLIASGKWPLLIPGLYAEFDTTLASAGSRVVREIRLLAAPVPDHCVIAYLLDEPGDITEQTRLDLARMVGSMEFGSPGRPFPTATPTNTPTPNPAPRPVLPLQISFDAKTSRSSSGGGNAEITIGIKDAYGNPVNNAEVTLSCGWGCRSVGLSRDGRYTAGYSSTSDDDQTVKVEVRWNQELIAQEDYVISWQ